MGHLPGFLRRGEYSPELVTHLERLSECQVGEEDVLLQHVAYLPLPSFTETFSVETDAAGVQLHASGQTIE